MNKFALYEYQLEAIHKLKNGCILCGGVGSGKSLTAIGYYYLNNGGNEEFLKGNDHAYMNNPKDLYIITTARKRDSQEWEHELTLFLLSTNEKSNFYSNKVVIDSWNNIKKYSDIKGASFIFDEQRLVGNGTWVKSFLKIAKVNDWILLSATPGDSYMDYVPIFIANGFFKNRTEFNREHVIYSRYTKFPKIDGYMNTTRLNRLRSRILIDMNFKRETTRHHETVYCQFDIPTYKDLFRHRWNIYTDQPMMNAAELCYVARRLVNSDESRQVALLKIVEEHPRVIVFYNFDYEREILLGMYYGDDVEIAEWSGHAHQDIPDGQKWIYICQYTSSCEGWNCTKTDTIVFFSQNYSYKVLEQACGRIDRLTTSYKDLYYYHFKSRAGIDLAIGKALNKKKKFNEGKFVKW